MVEFIMVKPCAKGDRVCMKPQSDDGDFSYVYKYFFK